MLVPKEVYLSFLVSLSTGSQNKTHEDEIDHCLRDDNCTVNTILWLQILGKLLEHANPSASQDDLLERRSSVNLQILNTESFFLAALILADRIFRPVQFI